MRVPEKSAAEWPVSTEVVAEDPDRVLRLLSDPEFEVLVEFRLVAIAQSALEYDIAIQEMIEILDAIDVSLGESRSSVKDQVGFRSRPQTMHTSRVRLPG